jgi:hypothetical protein
LENEGACIEVGLGFAGLELGLSDGAESHMLRYVGVTGSLGFGLSIRQLSPPSGTLDLQSDLRRYWTLSPAQSFLISAEALLWWVKDSPTPPPLVSTGILGQPGTTVNLGGEDLNTQMHPQ